MTHPELAYLTPEARARVEIDRMLAEAGWAVQDYSRANLSAARGVALREFVLRPPHGRVDYLLCVDSLAVGVIEAKKEGETLTGVAWQTGKYLDGLPDEVSMAVEGALPFAYQSTGVETRFTNTLDPAPASRQVFWFHRPETLASATALRDHPRAPSFRHRLQSLPALEETGLWAAQFRAIENLEESLAEGRPRAASRGRRRPTNRRAPDARPRGGARTRRARGAGDGRRGPRMVRCAGAPRWA